MTQNRKACGASLRQRMISWRRVISWKSSVPPVLLAGLLAPALLATGTTSSAAPPVLAAKKGELAAKRIPERILPAGQTRIFVADTAKNRVVSFNDMSGTGWATLTSAQGVTPGFSGPTGVSVPPSGLIASVAGTFGTGVYVADKLNRRVVKSNDITGAGGQVLGDGNPARVATTTLNVYARGGQLFVLTDPPPNQNSGGSRLLILNDTSGNGTVVTGAQIHGWSNPGPNGTDRGVGLLDGMAWDSHGKVYVSTSRSIVMLDALDPTALASSAGVVGTECCTNFAFTPTNRGRKIAIGPDGKIYVTDPSFVVQGQSITGRIVRIDNIYGDGFVDLKTACGHAFSSPSDIAVTSDGIYVLDTKNNRLVRFTDMTGANCVEFKGPTNDLLSAPSGLSVTRL